MTLSDTRPAILGGTPIRPQGPPTWPRSCDAICKVFASIAESQDWGRYLGPNVPAFCAALSDFHQVEHVHLCSSGTSAVELALRGVGVQPGDEVILAAYDFKANFQNVLLLGAVPVLVDLDPNSWQIDVTQIGGALSSRTRAILVSHLHGGCVEMNVVNEIANRHGIAVVEDACQNPGAILRGRRAGTAGDVGVISFGGSKLLTAGRGGAIVTRRRDVFERIQRYVHRGNDAYPLSEIQAALLRPQLKQLDELNQMRRDAVVHLIGKLSNCSGLKLLQEPTDENQTTYYKVGFQYDPPQFDGLSRNQFVRAMRAEGIAFDSGFRSLHLIHASRRFRSVGELAEAMRADSMMLTLHHPVLIESTQSIDEIASAVNKIRECAAEILDHEPPACETGNEIT